jgi:hypothetical protein
MLKKAFLFISIFMLKKAFLLVMLTDDDAAKTPTDS